MLRRSVTGYSKVENVGQNSSAKYPQQVKQFWRASVTDLLLKSFSFFFFFFFPSLSTNDSISPAIACFLSHLCAIQKDTLCVSLWSWLPRPSISFPCWMKNPLQMGYLRAESQASGLKTNALLLLNTTFLTVARKAKNHPPEFQFQVESGTLLEEATPAAGPPASKTVA